MAGTALLDQESHLLFSSDGHICAASASNVRGNQTIYTCRNWSRDAVERHGKQ
jgi:hypothetical protein